MLRLIFTLMSTAALLLLGSAWLATQPSGGEVRAVVAPVLERGLELAGFAAHRAGSALRSTAEAEARRVPLTPTASGVWEPDPEPAAEPEARPRETPPAPPQEPPAPARPKPEPVEEVHLAARTPFAEGPLPEPRPTLPEPRAPRLQGGDAPSLSAGKPPEPEVRAPRPDQDEWAALIRRMISVHGRVGSDR